MAQETFERRGKQRGDQRVQWRKERPISAVGGLEAFGFRYMEPHAREIDAFTEPFAYGGGVCDPYRCKPSTVRLCDVAAHHLKSPWKRIGRLMPHIDIHCSLADLYDNLSNTENTKEWVRKFGVQCLAHVSGARREHLTQHANVLLSGGGHTYGLSFFSQRV